MSLVNASLVPAPVSSSSILDRLTRTWDELIDQCRVCLTDELSARFELGDTLDQIAHQFSEDHLKRAARELCVGESFAKQHRWAATRFPVGHPMRSSPLSYSHVRALAGLDNDDVVQQLHDQGVKSKWTVAQLKAQIRRPEFAAYREGNGGRLPRAASVSCDTPAAPQYGSTEPPVRSGTYSPAGTNVEFPIETCTACGEHCAVQFSVINHATGDTGYLCNFDCLVGWADANLQDLDM
jgi:hypothetical protein